MRKEDFEELQQLVGKTIKEVRADTKYNVSDDYGFELVFDDDTSIDVIDIRCLAYDDCDMVGKEEKLTTYPDGKTIISKYQKEQLGGGVDWIIWPDQQLEDEKDENEG